LALAGLAGAQTNPAALAARAWRETHQRAMGGEFLGLPALPNLARDTEGIRQNAAAIAALFEMRGVKTRLLEVPGAPPAVYGEILTPGATAPSSFTHTTMASRSTPRSGPLRRGNPSCATVPSISAAV